MKVTLTRTWTCNIDISFSDHCSAELEAQILNEIRESKDEYMLWTTLSKYLYKETEDGFQILSSLGNVKGSNNSKMEVEGDKND